MAVAKVHSRADFRAGNTRPKPPPYRSSCCLPPYEHRHYHSAKPLALRADRLIIPALALPAVNIPPDTDVNVTQRMPKENEIAHNNNM